MINVLFFIEIRWIDKNKREELTLINRVAIVIYAMFHAILASLNHNAIIMVNFVKHQLISNNQIQLRKNLSTKKDKLVFGATNNSNKQILDYLG